MPVRAGERHTGTCYDARAVSPHSLYVCYFGLREPLVQTQVLPYLRELVRDGVRVSLLTFEPDRRRNWSDREVAEERSRQREDGIEWHLLPYHKRFSLLATAYDVVRGALYTARVVRAEGVNILHGRSHVATMIAAVVARFTRVRVVFDFRGFLAEEYVESGNWRRGGMLYRLTKMAERWLLRKADAFVVLTEQGRELLRPDVGDRPVAVIPCCFDTSRAGGDREAMRAELGVTGRTVIVYTGTLGGFYLTRETAALFAAIYEHDSSAFLLVLTKSSPAELVSALRELGVPSDAYAITRSAPDDVPRYLSAADVGVSLIASSRARLAASPTKVAEYLAAGLPVISTRGVGDLEAEISGSRVGVLLDGTTRADFDRAWSAMARLRSDAELAARCREHARRFYDLRAVGGPRYRRLYREVLGTT